MAWLISGWRWLTARAVWALGGLLAVSLLALQWMHRRMQEKDRAIARATSYVDTTKTLAHTKPITDPDDSRQWLQDWKDKDDQGD